MQEGRLPVGGEALVRCGWTDRTNNRSAAFHAPPESRFAAASRQWSAQKKHATNSANRTMVRELSMIARFFFFWFCFSRSMWESPQWCARFTGWSAEAARLRYLPRPVKSHTLFCASGGGSNMGRNPTIDYGGTPCVRLPHWCQRGAASGTAHRARLRKTGWPPGAG